MIKSILLWTRRYVTIYGVIMITSLIMCLLFNPGAEVSVVPFFGRILVFSGISVLSMGVYHAREELTPRAWWGRTALHLLLLEAVLLPLAHAWGFWHSGPDLLIYAAFILLAKALWHLTEYGVSARTAAEIKEQIRKKRLESRNGKEDDSHA